MNAPTRAEFLARRQKGIGGSDLAALMGLSPYKTPFQLWQEKTGRFEPDFSPEQEERMHWGTVLEDVVAKHYAEASSCKVQRINDQLTHPTWPVLTGNLDRVVVREGTRARWDGHAAAVLGATKVLEVKTASAYALRGSDDDTTGWGEAGTDQVPQHYWLQVQHYMSLANLFDADIAVLFGGQTFRVYTVKRDAPLMSGIFEQAADWWERHVVADVPPQPQTEEEAKLAWAAHTPGKTVVVGADIAEQIAELRRVKTQIAQLEEHETTLRNAITPLIGDAESVTYMGQKLATWKANKASSKTDWKAVAESLGPTPEQIAEHTTEKPGSRVLRLIAPKE